MDISPDEANRRQAEFAAEVLSSGTVWVLMQDGGLANWTEDNSVVIPLWDSEQKALECAAESFPGYETCSVGLNEFLHDWVPRLVDHGAWLAIQPVASTAGNQFPSRLFSSLFESDEI